MISLWTCWDSRFNLNLPRSLNFEEESAKLESRDRRENRINKASISKSGESTSSGHTPLDTNLILPKTPAAALVVLITIQTASRNPFVIQDDPLIHTADP